MKILTLIFAITLLTGCATADIKNEFELKRQNILACTAKNTSIESVTTTGNIDKDIKDIEKMVLEAAKKCAEEEFKVPVK